jgi:hypothetical protein
MARNPLLDEIYAARDALLAEHNGDIHAYVADARQRALASGRAIVAPQPETTLDEATEETPAADSDRLNPTR